MVEIFEMFGEYQLQKQEIIYKLKGIELKRTAFCLLKDGKIVLVMWDRADPNRINNVIAQIEAIGAIQKTG